MARSDISQTIAERLNWLFDNVLGPTGKPFSHQDVEDGTAALGYRVTTSTIWSIRHNKTPNPGILTLRSVAHFFGVESSFFLRDELDDDGLTLIRTHAQPEDPVLHEIMECATSVDYEARQAILGVLRLIRRA